jgi:hypothetical protein
MVKASRCGRGDPVSTPGVDIYLPIRDILQCSLSYRRQKRQNTIDNHLAPAATIKQSCKGPH